MSTLERAVVIAAEGHAGVPDKAGAPYILHPLRVMLATTSRNGQIVGVLHDVVGDHPASPPPIPSGPRACISACWRVFATDWRKIARFDRHGCVVGSVGSFQSILLID
jgi:hypothetical protein